MTNGEILDRLFPDGIAPFSKAWCNDEYKANDILGAIIAEINQSINDNPKYKNNYTQGINDGLCHALHIIVKHRYSKNEIID